MNYICILFVCMCYMYVLYEHNATYLLHLKPNDFNKIESLAERFE